MADSRTAIDPVTLPSWPTSTENLSWSEDHLAVATGELVHILTPEGEAKSTISVFSGWHVETIRVNQFSETEWPRFTLATLPDFSLGEDQSRSTVSGLAWSPSNIGIHARHVLAVLSTGLVLSIWESTGVPGSWRRTCVINQQTSGNKDSTRRERRIRAFSWLPTLPSTRKGQNSYSQYLLTVDDDANVSLLSIQKSRSHLLGDWNVSLLYKHKLTFDDVPHAGVMSVLQRALNESPVSQIRVGRWETLSVENEAVTGSRLTLQFFRGPHQCGSSSLILHRELQSNSEIVFLGRIANISDLLPPNQPDLAKRDINVSLAQPKEEFEEHYNLKGLVRVKHWGSARSADASTIAACVTFHPSDTIEYTIPSHERCTVVFIKIQETSCATTEVRGDPRLELLHWISEHASIETMNAKTDAKVIRVAAACVATAFDAHNELMEWSRGAEELALNFEAATGVDKNGDADEGTESHTMRAATSETCEMCDTTIDITQDLSSGRCSKGHVFARCGISFLAIQEPGISKYCSRCGKQFLDLSKLGPQDGPSLSMALFEEFDVCPYCRGKFRG